VRIHFLKKKRPTEGCWMVGLWDCFFFKLMFKQILMRGGEGPHPTNRVRKKMGIESFF
jgi:hypothetical protein